MTDPFVPLSSTFSSYNANIGSKPKPMYQIRMETRLKKNKLNLAMGKKEKRTQDTWKPGIINDVKQQHQCPSQTQFQERYKFKQERDMMLKGENIMMKNLVKREETAKYVNQLKSMTQEHRPKAKGAFYDKVCAIQSESVAPLLNQNEGFL